MILNDAVAAELPYLRAEAEALFTDSFEFRNYGDGWRYDKVQRKDVREFTLLYSAPGKVVTSTVAGESQVGDRTSAEIGRQLHVSAACATVPNGTVAHRVSDGVEFRVVADVTNAHPKSRRFQVEEVLS